MHAQRLADDKHRQQRLIAQQQLQVRAWILDAREEYVLPDLEGVPTLRAGNAGSLYFSVGGQTYGPAGVGPSVVKNVPLTPEVDFFAELEKAITDSWPRPKMLVLNFPGNPTAHCVERDFFERVVAVAREHGIWVVHDIAYAELVFDGYRAPSILEAPSMFQAARLVGATTRYVQSGS